MNLKQLTEKRNTLVEQINELFKSAETEERAFKPEEKQTYDACMDEIRSIDSTIKAIEESKDLAVKEVEETRVNDEPDEHRAFIDYIKENRANQNWTFGDNGAVIPTTIANKIIKRITEICPIYALTTKYNEKGNLQFPVYDETTDKITVAYATEFTELEAHAGKFTSVTLGGYLVGALTKISKSLMNSATFDIEGYVVSEISTKIAEFLENQLINGTGTTSMTGIMANDNNIEKVTFATDIGVDDLIDAQLKIPQSYQGECRWLVNTKTLATLRKLKDGNQRYLLQDDIVNGFGFTLLGKPVMVSDRVPDDTIVYGDFSALYVNIRSNVEMQVLREKYATMHAVGVCAYFEMDSKVIEPQKLVKIVTGE